MLLEVTIILDTPANSNSFVKDVLPYISTGLVLLIFLYDRIKGHKQRKEESRRTWYFKAFFENSVKKIDEFISNCDLIVEMEINEKLGLTVKGIDPSDRRSAQERLSDCKRRFSLNVIQVLQISYNNLFENLEEILRNIEDEGILAMENVKDKDQYWKFSQSLNTNKALILAKMSEPALGKIKLPKN
jgi:hypothetical protein